MKEAFLFWTVEIAAKSPSELCFQLILGAGVANWNQATPDDGRNAQLQPELFPVADQELEQGIDKSPQASANA